jgi:subtilase family serine protease
MPVRSASSARCPRRGQHITVVASSGDNGAMRGVPDVAADASPFTGTAHASIVDGMRVIEPSDGTSAGAPFWAAIVALADQYAGHPLGFITPAIYRIGHSPGYQLPGRTWLGPGHRLGQPQCPGPRSPSCPGVGMSSTALIVDGVLELAMIGVSLYGAVTLPPGARMPLHFGPAGYNQWVPKNVGLVIWPGLGLVVSVIINVATRNHQTHGSLGPVAGLSIALGVMLITEIGALAVARSRDR